MAIASARVSNGKISLAVRYAELAAADEKKNTAIHAMVCVHAVSAIAPNRIAVAIRRMPPAAYVPVIMVRRGVEQRPQQQRTHEVAEGKGYQVESCLVLWNSVELREHQAVGKKSGIEQKGLRDHQCQGE